jgi:Bacteriocin-protection, YdeI or OmpD-Associated/Domain of unknown function (DUF1905)
MTKHTFDTTVEQSGRTATSFEVPLDVRDLFGSTHPPIKVTINTHTYRTTPAVYGGRYYVSLSKPNREAARVAADERITVTIEHDGDPRKIEAPPDLAAALDDDDDAREFWDRLSYSHRREYVEWLDDAKRSATRAKRIEKAVEALRGGQPKR